MGDQELPEAIRTLLDRLGRTGEVSGELRQSGGEMLLGERLAAHISAISLVLTIALLSNQHAAAVIDTKP